MEREIRPYIMAKNLSRWNEIAHGFTNRQAPDDLLKIFDSMSVPHRNFFALRQIHSREVYCYRYEDSLHHRLPVPEGDAIITSEDYVMIGVKTADCVPLLVFDPNEMVVAAIHAGWRGLVNGVIENTLEEMQNGYRTNPLSLRVAMGPALCQRCFEVGSEVADLFQKKFGKALPISRGKGDRKHLDLREACRQILTAQGIEPENIETLPFCTMCHHDRFYSCRKGDRDRRSIAFIGLKGWLFEPEAA